MENNHKLALFVAYYLSRFNVEGYQNLGYKTMLEAHKKIGLILNTNPHTVKNMRDQFDPLHGHRVGWYQAPLSPSRVHVVEALQDLAEFEIRSIIIDILNNSIDVYEKEKLLSIIESEYDDNIRRQFILRGPTGRKAEEHYINYFKKSQMPVSGKLNDTRDLGVGYDFMIELNGIEYFIEVKGLSEITGGVLFTNKEWEVAKSKKNEYFLVIVSDINSIPVVNFIQNPAEKLKSKKNIIKTIQINYSITKNEVERALNK